MRRFRKQFAIAVILLLLMSGAASAATDSKTSPDSHPPLGYKAYLKLDGISGESTARGYENWILLSGVQFDVTNAITVANGAGSGSGKANLNQFVVTKKSDASSVPIFLASLSGTAIKRGQIALVPLGDGATPIMTIDLDSILIAGFSFDNAYETLLFKFDSLKFTYFPTDSKGGKGTPVSGGWSFSQNKKL
ncbi:type VI secretion system tube protein Hcp [Cohnella endophytica]|uniref:Type VI secretion system tube protein Hcp n=1 Tax=Cohnella endophytica TaxID=2419778 RepID=A0A494XJV7_9BACL|nr:type VI secretion system tube protein Hcp [Cohnella endophytica]RKP50001.1 type VI secretion system tube protein Hcp [Cohnella endophytica]